MIGFVIVAHSAKLAEGVCELAGQAVQGKVRLAPAGGAGNPENPIGTDAYKVLEAIESVYSEDGVIVLMDLGSALLSAETALELLDADKRKRVRLCAAPLVEGAVAAASQAAAGAGLEEILREAESALAAKRAGPGLAPMAAEPLGTSPDLLEQRVTVPNPFGLHARPAAQVVRLARRCDAALSLENLTRRSGPADCASINSVLALGARQGDHLLIRAWGKEGRRALAELAAFIESGCGDRQAPAPEPAVLRRSASGELAGMPASPGIAIGPLVRLRPPAVEVTSRPADDPEAERRRLLEAIRAARQETRALFEWAQTHAGADEAGIFDAQELLLEDAALIERASRIILDQRVSAEYAWQAAATEFAARLEALDDPYLRARAADVADVAHRVLRGLTGGAIAAPALSRPSILAAYDLKPSEVRGLDPDLALGLCLEAGAPGAHAVILARARGIPVVVGLGPALSALAEGTTVALDGQRGVVYVSPNAEQLRELQRRRAEWLASRRAADADKHKPALTRDGRRIRVLANIGGLAEAAEALDCGAEGVGVLRTEFLFLGRSAPPSEEEQFSAYCTVAEALGGRPVVIRTLDVGGDKSLPYVEIGAEANPFLGWRGIRVSLGRPDLFKTQLRAILRAAAEHPVEVLFPMVSSLTELREAVAILREAEAELAREGLPFRKQMRAGIMIEVPAAVAAADELAREAAFFSIGSNDLIQYLMAADRTNPRVAAIADPFHPAVLRTMRQAIEAGRRAGIEVTLCGELAAETLATPLLIGLGLDEFSVSAPLVPELKRAIAQWSFAEAQAIAQEALSMDSAASVRRLLVERGCPAGPRPIS